MDASHSFWYHIHINKITTGDPLTAVPMASLTVLPIFLAYIEVLYEYDVII